jgi:large subunit ribosomal protein L15
MDELQPGGSASKPRKRIGRGNATGQGTYAGKGLKGQKARSGGGPGPRFEGGQLPLIKRLPEKRGFKNKWRIEYAVINVGDLAELDAGSEISPDILREAGIVKSKLPIKILGDGEFSTKLTVSAHKFSASAKEKIEAAGGTIEEIPYTRVRPSRSRGANPRPKSAR